MAANPEALMLETARPWTRPSGISGYRCLGFRLSGRHVPVAEPSPLLAELKDLDLRPCPPHDKALHHAVQHRIPPPNTALPNEGMDEDIGV